LPAKLAEFEQWAANAGKALADGSSIPEIPIELPQYPGSVGGSYLFNGMIAPIIPYGIRGVLWYQGENNGGEGESYFIKQRALIETWRQLWGRGDFPFYFVQLPQYDKANPDPAGGDGWAKFREAQRKTLTVPSIGMAVTIDVGDANNIHPGNK
jgi:sialate O-acetylesterase